MSKLITSCVLFFFLVWLTSPIAAYNVVDFGAQPDGQTDSTSPFLRAWMAACSSVGTATIYVPFGTFLIKPIIFSGPCKNRVIFKIDGTIVAPQDYRALRNSGCWILFREVSMVSIRGGTIDARGAGFWECRKSGRNCPVGAKSIMFLGSNKVIISGLKSLNSQNIHIAIDHCNNLLIEDVRITAPSESPNTDGINVQASSGVTIRNNTIMTGDDCIAIGPGSRHLWMEKIACGPGHGISIGSLGHSLQEDGVWNVTVTGAVFTKTQNGVRIKSWGRPSNGYATDIHFRNIKMIDVSNPIIIDQKYCPNNMCPHQTSGVKVSEVTYSNINGTSATEAAVIFECSSSNPCTGISLQDIKLSHFNKQATAYCNNARGTSTGIVIPNSCLWK